MNPTPRLGIAVSPDHLVATLTMSPVATALDQARPLIVPGRLRRAAMALGELLAAVGIALCVPVVMLVIGLPLVLGMRFLLWIAGML